MADQLTLRFEEWIVYGMLETAEDMLLEEMLSEASYTSIHPQIENCLAARVKKRAEKHIKAADRQLQSFIKDMAIRDYAMELPSDQKAMLSDGLGRAAEKLERKAQAMRMFASRLGNLDEMVSSLGELVAKEFEAHPIEDIEITVS